MKSMYEKMMFPYAKQCECGAVTVYFDQQNNASMPFEKYQEKFNHIKIESEKFHTCNYCVNHWGIDLCGCGSGEKLGECSEDLFPCKNNVPSQTLPLDEL